MSVETLCDKTCDICESAVVNNAIGSYKIVIAKKYPLEKCRITKVKVDEDIANRKEKEIPSQYKIYFPKQLNILNTDYITLDNIRYDILHVNKCYKHHMQILVQRNNDQNIEVLEGYLIASHTGTNVIFITQENSGYIEIEE
jgi:ribosome-associated protein YbcJ (S4-like RNA binding protein)